MGYVFMGSWKFNFLTLLGFIAIIFSGCAERDLVVRNYEEVVSEPTRAQAPVAESEDPHAALIPSPPSDGYSSTQESSFTWETPVGWREEPGVGMRLATLWVDAEPESAEITLIVLRGETGSLEANIVRWMGQVQIAPPSADELSYYIDNLKKFTTEGGHEGVFIDFDEWVENPADASTLGGIIRRGQETLFVKATGSKELLAQQRDAFLELCRSIR